MQIEVWLVVAACNLDDLPIAAFNSPEEANELIRFLNALPTAKRGQVVIDAWELSGLPDQSEFIQFQVRHVPTCIVQLPASRSRRVTGP